MFLSFSFCHSFFVSSYVLEMTAANLHPRLQSSIDVGLNWRWIYYYVMQVDYDYRQTIKRTLPNLSTLDDKSLADADASLTQNVFDADWAYLEELQKDALLIESLDSEKETGVWGFCETAKCGDRACCCLEAKLTRAVNVFM